MNPAALPSIIRVPPFESLLEGAKLVPNFQPIVKLGDPFDHLFGFESLARFPSDSPLIDIEFLFRYAERKDRVNDLDSHCLRNSLRFGAPLTNHGNVFVNLHPALLKQPSLTRKLTTMCREASFPLDRLVVEITEQGSIDQHAIARQNLQELREAGIRLAIDDVGVAYSHLLMMDDIQPSFLKISQHFGTDFESDPTRTKIVRNILGLAQEFGCDVIIEGVETEDTGRAAREMGIRYAQGYYYGRPAPVQQVFHGSSSTKMPSAGSSPADGNSYLAGSAETA